MACCGSGRLRKIPSLNPCDSIRLNSKIRVGGRSLWSLEVFINDWLELSSLIKENDCQPKTPQSRILILLNSDWKSLQTEYKEPPLPFDLLNRNKTTTVLQLVNVIKSKLPLCKICGGNGCESCRNKGF